MSSLEIIPLLKTLDDLTTWEIKNGIPVPIGPAAHMLGVSRQCIYAKLGTGKLRGCRLGGLFCISHFDLIKWKRAIDKASSVQPRK